jgi:hypothetical protein
VPNFVLGGFDKWCRIVSGMSNAKIAAAVSTPDRNFSEEDVVSWRNGGALPDPSTTLLPLRVALKGPWPTATAEQAWVELLEVLSKAEPHEGPIVLKSAPALEPIRSSPVRPKPAAAAVDPVLEACKVEMELAADEVTQVCYLADQIRAGWFARAIDKIKKYQASRDAKHRKAYLQFCLQRGETLVEKASNMRSELTAKRDRLAAAVGTFDTMQRECSIRMERKLDENVGLWKQIKASAALIATSRQTLDRANSKSLTGLEDTLKRAQTATGDWKSKISAISEDGKISLNWLTKESKLGQRLIQRGAVGSDVDPFEGLCVCNDKLADNYKSGTPGAAEKPVEIDLAGEIDLTVLGLEGRQQALKSLLG